MTAHQIQVANPPREKPLLLFDGECAFCRRWVERWKALTSDRVDYRTSQAGSGDFPEIPSEYFQTAVLLITPQGDVISGAEAVFTCLREAHLRGWMVRAYHGSPLFARTSEAVYRQVSRRRRLASFLTRILLGRCLLPSTYRWSSWIFPRLLGLLSLCAVISYWTQAAGLIGSEGILPISPYLEKLGTALSESSDQDRSKWLLFPTVFWWSSTDLAITLVFAVTAVASVALILGILPGPAAFTLWAGYLSLLHAGQTFLTFQWDILLVETLLLATFLGPWKILDRLSRHRDPSAIIRLLIWFLLFRLMFESGIVKLQSYEGTGAVNTWRDFTALDYHYWTQPLPAWTSWYLHHFPKGVHLLSLGATYAVELALPFLFFAPRRLRNFALLSQVLLQLAIMVTGNYGYFNLLTILLCVPLIDDQNLPARLREKLAAHTFSLSRTFVPPFLRTAVALSLAVVILPIGLFQLNQACEDTRQPSASADWIERHSGFASTLRSIRPFLSVNGYGLFRVMTRTRPEIIISGSADGLKWIDYRFSYKPGDPGRPPGFLIPHMPRLDWQMWFEGLRFERSGRLSPWFARFLTELAEGNPTVVALLEQNPFPEAPPKLLRVQLFHYSFTTPAMKSESGHWWQRELLESYTRQFRTGK
jgi:predicted DCC family thiol-disulfide oxidoreductase YuxK